MATRKRAHQELERSEDDSSRNVKPKTDRAAQAANESNSDSSYVSAAAAVFSDSEGDTDTAQSDVESDSDLSTSSDEPSSISGESGEEESDGEGSDVRSDGTPVAEERTNVRPGSKPNITREETVDGGLLNRLRKFLPDLEAANKELEKEREAGRLADRSIETVDEEGPYVEMNLGLGVFEGKAQGVDNEGNQDGDNEEEGQNEDILGTLMGQQKGSRKAVQIQEVGDG